jgi:hypothetical protein
MKVKWDEPVDFWRAAAQAAGAVPTRKKQVWIGLAAAAVVAVIIPAFQLLFYLLHNKAFEVPLWVYFFAPAISGVFMGALPSLIAAIPAKIIVHAKGIHRNKAIGSELSIEFWPWESIAAMTIENVTYGQATFRVLVLHTEKEPGEILIGLGKAPVEQIEQIARQMGKPLTIQ